MSVASKNAFALLGDENSASTPAPAQAAAESTAKTDGKPAQKKGPPRTGGRYYQRGGKPKTDAPTTATEGEDPAGGEKRYDRGGDRGGDRGRGRGGRGRGRGRGGYGDRPDRHSQTGIVDSHKKVHQGWGGDRGDTELQQETAAQADATKDAGDNWGAGEDAWGDAAPAADGETSKADGAAAEDQEADAKAKARRAEEEEDDSKITLEEYRKKNAGAASEAVPKLEIRKANEGSSDLFKDAVQLTKDTEGENYFKAAKNKPQPKSGGKSAPEPPKREKATKTEKVYLEIDARFERPDRGRGRGRGGDRGGRRPPRGDRPRNAGYGGRQSGQPQSPDVEDTNQFPSL